MKVAAIETGYVDLVSGACLAEVDSQSQHDTLVAMLEQLQRKERNPGAIPLEIIEVQSSSYLSEDNAVRFENTYGRSL